MSDLSVVRHELFPEVLTGCNALKIDERGAFRRLIDLDAVNFALAKFGEDPFQALQSNFSSNLKSGTWRGLHAQIAPFAETKVVTCVRGSVLDFFADMRPDSPNYLKLGHQPLTSNQGEFVVIPKGFAHGYLTLEEDSAVVYFVDAAYSSQHEVGFNILDPVLKFESGHKITAISEKDQQWPSIKL
jgi:dTDP-4-dehydrorhamnose 3,5-epimerase